MADIVVTAAQVAPVNEIQYIGRTYKADAAITAGQAVYHKSDGEAAPALATAVGTSKFLGIALQTVGAGQAVDVIQEGGVFGFALAGVAYGATVYLSATAAGAVDGVIIAGAGNVITPVGVVDCIPDLTKFLRVSFDLTRVPVALGA